MATYAINVKFSDNFGGLRTLSIPSCKVEPCDIVQGEPLIVFLTFVPESPKWPQGKDFDIFTTGYLNTMMHGYGNAFGVGITRYTDLTKYNPSFPLKPNQISTARLPLVAPRIDPSKGPFSTTGKKLVDFLINVGNATDFITVVSTSIYLNVIRK